jgi:hypothetical protein
VIGRKLRWEAKNLFARASGGQFPSIDADDLPGDERRPVRREIQIRELTGKAQPSQWVAAYDPERTFVGDALHRALRAIFTLALKVVALDVQAGAI